MAQYMNCGTDDERSDFFAFNDYSWCDPSSFTQSGWSDKVKTFSTYGLPLFLSEYGCNTNKRQFQEVGSLYSTQMTGVYSGGLVYEYAEEGNNYGLVEINGSNVTELDDFTALKTAFKNTPNPSGDGGYNQTGGANACPAQQLPAWNVTNDALPAIPEPAKKYMTQGAGTGPGFSGPGSQDRGTSSTGTAAPGSGSGGASASGTSSSSSASGSASKSKSAAAGLQVPEMTMAPIVCGLVITLSTFFGASLIMF